MQKARLSRVVEGVPAALDRIRCADRAEAESGSPLLFESIERRLLLSVAPIEAVSPLLAPPPSAAPAIVEVQPASAATGAASAASPAVSVSFDRNAANFQLRSVSGSAAQVTMTVVGARASGSGAADESPLGGDGAVAPVRYDAIYDGIDLVYHHAADGALEYDWLVEPNANTGSIRLSFSGAFGIDIQADGDLALHTTAGDLIEHAPVVYQEVDGQRTGVDGHFVLLGGGPGHFEVGFKVDSYDRSHELVIDPTVGYSTYLGGAGNDVISLTTTDADGNTYVLGTTTSLKLGAPDGGTGDPNAFWAKYDAQGHLQYAQVVAVPAEPNHGTQSVGEGLLIGADGTPYVLLSTTDTDFNTFTSSAQLHLATIGANGERTSDLVLLDTGEPAAIAAHVYDVGATGMTTGPDGSIYVSALQLRATPGGGAAEDDFIIKVQPDAGIVFKEPIFQAPKGMAIDAGGNIYVAFDTHRNDLPGADGVRSANRSDSDLYVIELDPTATGVLFASYIGGAGNEYLGAMTMSPTEPGVLYLTGATASTDLPAPDAATGAGFQPALHPASPERGGQITMDGFVLKFDIGAQKVLASTYLGGGGEDELTGIALDSLGNVYVSGQTNSPDFPVVDALFSSYTPGDPITNYLYTYDDVVAKLNPTLSSLLFSTYIGGSGHDSAQLIQIGIGGGPKIKVDDVGTIHVAGTTASADFPTLNAAQPNFAGGVFGGSSTLFTITREPSDGVLFTVQQRGALAGRGALASQGIAFSGVVADIRGGRVGAKPDDYDVTIDWGDGNDSVSAGWVTRANPQSASMEVNGSHAYEKPGAYAVEVKVVDRKTGEELLTNINVSGMTGVQFEPTIAVDPKNPLRMFSAAVDETSLSKIKLGSDASKSGGGLFAAYSTDGGLNWARRRMADGTDGTPLALGDPKAVFDAYGNLFLTYLGAARNTVVLVVSKDGGKTFGLVDELVAPGSSPGGDLAVDQPSVAVGDGVVWITYEDKTNHNVVAAGAAVTGLDKVGSLSSFVIPDSENGGFGDIKVGPHGEVLVLWQQDPNVVSNPSLGVYSALDPDGLGPEPFGPARPVASSSLLPGTIIPPLLRSGVTPEFNLAWDLTRGSMGRVYVAYTEANPAVPSDLDIWLRYSDDAGATWQAPVRVSKDSSGGIQFLPSLAVDAKTGVVAVGWYDTRLGFDNTTADYFVATSADGGATFGRNIRVSKASSDATAADESKTQKDKGYGDYSSISFVDGVLHPVWADNSTGLIGIPDRPQMDIATMAIGIVTVAPARVQIRPTPITAVKNAAFSGQVATFTISDPARLPADFSATIQWGDGETSDASATTVSQPGGPGTPFVVTAGHTYGEAGAFPVWVTVTDLRSKVQTTAVSDVTRMQGSQSENSIAIDPTNPNRVFAASNDLSLHTATRGAVARSDDGGVTWTSSLVGDGTDGLPTSHGDVKVAYDQFGNLFLSYLTEGQPRAVVLLLSIDGGLTFKTIATFADSDSADQPSIAVGPGRDGQAGSIWLTWERGDSPFQVIMAAGADVTGLGAVSGFQQHYVAPALVDGVFRNFGDIVIGPKGEVVLTYARGIAGVSTTGPSELVVQVDPDGLGPAAFGPEIFVTDTEIGSHAPISAQATRTIDAAGNLAWDLSDGAHAGRLYLSYTDAAQEIGSDGKFHVTNVVLRYSDDLGQHWSEPITVTDAAVGESFFPAIAVDQSSGNVGLSWYETVNGDQTQTRETATISDDGGVTWKRVAYPVAPGNSNATASTLDPLGLQNQYGDYTGLAFAGGMLQPIWADNSVELDGNPDPQRFEAANARIAIATVSGPPLVMQAVAVKGVAGTPLTAPLARFTDPEGARPVEQYKAIIDWGDGTTPGAGRVTRNDDGSFSVLGDHEYKKDGSFTAAVSVIGPRTTGQTSAKVEIAKAPQTLDFAGDGGRVRVVRETDFTEVLATLTDGNHNSSAADFDVTIDWGDGSFSDGVVKLVKAGAAGEPNEFSVSGTHNYLAEQTFAVQITVRVKADGTKLDTSGAIVNGDPPMTLDSTNDIDAALAGVTVGDRLLAVFNVDGDIQSGVGEYIATITGATARSTPTSSPSSAATSPWSGATPTPTPACTTPQSPSSTTAATSPPHRW
jgi:hypothetical protein